MINDIPDEYTQVQRSDYPYSWTDVIGNDVFEIYGLNWSLTGNNLTFDIFTNFPKTGDEVGNWYTKPGDFMLDLDRDGTFEYALALVNHSDTVEDDGNIAAGIADMRWNRRFNAHCHRDSVPDGLWP